MALGKGEGAREYFAEAVQRRKSAGCGLRSSVR